MADARWAFLEELIDDAGLFPPASLGLDAAVAQHRAARAGPHAWILARFICPASRLTDLTRKLDAGEPSRLSVLLDGTADEGEAAIRRGLEASGAFVREAGERVTVELVEAKLPVTDVSSVDDLIAEMEHAGLRGAIPFFEVEVDDRLEAALDAIAGAPAGAKLRCGGATPRSFPAPAAVAAFLDGCRRRGLRCKATAGLHHPFRHTDPATGFVQHGFVNLVGAAILAGEHDLGQEDLEPILAEEDPDAFRLDADGFGWRDLDAGASAIEGARRSLFFAYGSCSFDEPVEDLLRLGILPVEP